jgi:hypothetical protein
VIQQWELQQRIPLWSFLKSFACQKTQTRDLFIIHVAHFKMVVGNWSQGAFRVLNFGDLRREFDKLQYYLYLMLVYLRCRVYMECTLELIMSRHSSPISEWSIYFEYLYGIFKWSSVLSLDYIRGAPELSSGRNPDFSEFRFRPELIKKAWPEPELCRLQRDRISNVFLSDKSSQ